MCTVLATIFTNAYLDFYLDSTDHKHKYHYKYGPFIRQFGIQINYVHDIQGDPNIFHH